MVELRKKIVKFSKIRNSTGIMNMIDGNSRKEEIASFSTSRHQKGIFQFLT